MRLDCCTCNVVRRRPEGVLVEGSLWEAEEGDALLGKAGMELLKFHRVWLRFVGEGVVLTTKALDV